MIKYYCDVCGVELDNPSRYTIEILGFGPHIDLCESHRDLLIKTWENFPGRDKE